MEKNDPLKTLMVSFSKNINITGTDDESQDVSKYKHTSKNSMGSFEQRSDALGFLGDITTCAILYISKCLVEVTKRVTSSL